MNTTGTSDRRLESTASQLEPFQGNPSSRRDATGPEDATEVYLLRLQPAAVRSKTFEWRLLVPDPVDFYIWQWSRSVFLDYNRTLAGHVSLTNPQLYKEESLIPKSFIEDLAYCRDIFLKHRVTVMLSGETALGNLRKVCSRHLKISFPFQAWTKHFVRLIRGRVRRGLDPFRFLGWYREGAFVSYVTNTNLLILSSEWQSEIEIELIKDNRLYLTEFLGKVFSSSWHEQRSPSNHPIFLLDLRVQPDQLYEMELIAGKVAIDVSVMYVEEDRSWTSSIVESTREEVR